MLSDALIEHILNTIPDKRIGILGDLFLDRYLDIDADLTEPSIETGLDAYQVVGVRSFPGALGTILNNLIALGAGSVHPFAVIGDDGEGYELRQALERVPAVRNDAILHRADRRTPTYTKPMLLRRGQPPRELNRLDIKNREVMPIDAQEQVWKHFVESWEDLDALIVLDQVSEPDCGVITSLIRDRLAELGRRHPERFILVDSRKRIGLFRNVNLKPNLAECLDATGMEASSWRQALGELAGRCGRRVYCTRGDEGIAIAMNEGVRDDFVLLPVYPVAGPIDVVGAGDSCSAGITSAIISGASPAEAAAFGNLVASITIQQIGTTGTATPKQVRERWQQVKDNQDRS